MLHEILHKLCVPRVFKLSLHKYGAWGDAHTVRLWLLKVGETFLFSPKHLTLVQLAWFWLKKSKKVGKNLISEKLWKMHADVHYTHTHSDALKVSWTCTRQLVFQSCRCSVQLQHCHTCQRLESFLPQPPLFWGGAIKAYGEHNSEAGGGGEGEQWKQWKEEEKKRWSGRCRGERRGLEGERFHSPAAMLDQKLAKRTKEV